MVFNEGIMMSSYLAEHYPHLWKISIIINVTQLNFCYIHKMPVNYEQYWGWHFSVSDLCYLRLNVTYSIIKYEMIHLIEGDLHGIG